MSKRKKNVEGFTQKILELFKKDRSHGFNFKQISAKIGVNDTNSRNNIIKILKKLQNQGTLQEIERGKYILTPSMNYHTGVLDITSRGKGYVMVDGMEDDIFIISKNLNKGLKGDVVEVYVFKRRRNGKVEGEITKIIKRKRQEFVGTITVSDRFAFVECTGYNMYTDIFIPKSKINNAQNGDKVLVKMEGWEEHSDSPIGSVIKVLGKPGEHNTEIHAILAQYGLPYEFPSKVEEYAKGLDTSIQASEIKKRRDIRDILTFTIDPKDAKDFDDALSFQKLKNGNYKIGIHIADVSHYVRPGNVLDDEAYERATSVYLVDRVVSMLLEVISNNACSLRPYEEKYTFSVLFEINNKAEIINTWYGRTVTYSDARFTYEEAQYVIENPTKDII
ncbi:MAG: ribonuclease R, partial [Bacteroidetes bacterium]